MGLIEEMVEQAFSRLKEGYFEDARDAFSECLLLESRDPKIYYGRGMALFQLKEWKPACEDFAKAKELAPEDLESWVALGLSLACDNKIYESIDVFEELLKRHPRFVRGHIQLAQLYYRMGVIKKGHAELDIAARSGASLDERRQIETMKNEQLTLDKRRFYKPDFEELHKQDLSSGPGFFGRIKALFGKK